MKKTTIAMLREKELFKLAELTKDITVAKNLMNRYYRLAGIDRRLLHLENDKRTCNKYLTLKLSEEHDKMFERLNGDFKQYGLVLEYYGYLPTITDYKNGNEVIYTFFYTE